ncbi:MAG TPA: response regulator transcription factor [Thermoanaerobaculia bacterium]
MRILIADDQILFREGLRSLLESQDHEVVGEASNGRDAIRLALELLPDLVLMDLTMPELDGLAATRFIVAERPEIIVVILTASEDDSKLFDAIKAGAQGFLIKNLDAHEFFRMIARVSRGEPALTPALAKKLLQEFARPPAAPDQLTPREREVLELMVEGLTTNRKLARRLNVSENTIKFHVGNILEKLRLSNRAEAVGYALRNRMVDPSND